MNTEEGLKREIGLWGLTSNIINVTIGSGIFVLPAIVAEGLGSAGILAYLFCGFLITLILLCFAEVGSKVHITGGAYAYIEVAFGKYFGFIAGMLLIFGACLMATAAVANAFVDTLSYLMPVVGTRWFRIGFFLAIFSVLAISHVSGVKKGTSLVNVMTIAKLAPLLLLILWGSTKLVAENLLWQKIPAMNDIGKVSLILFFAFQGAESSVSVSGEVKNPRKTMPKAIFLSYLIVIIFYLSIQLVCQGILGDSFPNFKDAPLAEAAKRLMGPFGTTLMIVGASISMLGYMSGDTMNMPRVLFRSAKDQVIPIKPLAMVHKKFATPYVAVLVYIGLSCLFAITGEFKELAILSSASVLLVYLGVALAVVKLRKSLPYNQNDFRIPGGFIIPGLAAITIFWFLSHLTTHEMIGMGITLVVLTAIFFTIKLTGKKKNLP